MTSAHGSGIRRAATAPMKSVGSYSATGGAVLNDMLQAMFGEWGIPPATGYILALVVIFLAGGGFAKLWNWVRINLVCVQARKLDPEQVLRRAGS